MIPGIGRARIALMEKYFGDLQDAWRADTREFAQAGLDAGSVQSIANWRSKIEPEREMEKASKAGIQVLIPGDSAYPARLQEIYDHPAILYVKGAIIDSDKLSLAVVGTRKPTIYGRQVTDELTAHITNYGFTICSGLARGIDTIAHQTALKNNGRTMAVLGSGLNVVYPVENRDLANRIVDHGCIISEYPIDSGPRAENFPRRNRIISGLTLGTLVTEAGNSSGACITAEFALEQNREVFAVPGSIYSAQSQGTNKLLQHGAKLVRNVSDIMDELNLGSTMNQLDFKHLVPENETETLIINFLSQEAKHIDEVCRSSGMSIGLVSSTLAMMELKGLVRQLGGMNYALVRK